MEEEKKQEKQNVVEDVLVVEKLPQAELRIGKDEKGKEYQLLTVSEALTEIYKDMKELKSGVLGK